MGKALKNIHPLLPVKDLDVSIAFYTGKLGFKEAYRDEGGFTILCRDDCSIFLSPKQRDIDLRNQTARAKVDGYACYDLHIECARGTVDALWKEFKDAGATMPACFADGPVNRNYGTRDFSIIDPDGYDLVFGSPLED